MNTFEINKGYFRVLDGKTAYNLHVDDNRDYSNLPEPEYIYLKCQDKGLPGDRTIDVMLKFIHRRRIFKGDWLGDLDLCIALIGPRGSGKSVGATGIAVLDGLLAGRRVISNMPIAVKVRYKDCEKVFQTEDLDAAMMLDINEFNDNYFNCMIVVDEANVFIADSYRSTSNQSLFFSYILQQMRHRQLDFIFTTQNEAWQTSRVRFQTDFYVRCRDEAMLVEGKPKKEDIGRKSRWELFDMSGLVTGDVLSTDFRSNKVPPYNELTFWNVPFWNCYSTELMQRRDKFNLAQKQADDTTFDESHLKAIAERYNVPSQAILQAVNMGIERIQKSELWEMFGIPGDRSKQIKIGRILSELGCKTIHGTNEYEYIFPTQADMIKKLADMGISINIKEE